MVQGKYFGHVISLSCEITTTTHTKKKKKKEFRLFCHTLSRLDLFSAQTRSLPRQINVNMFLAEPKSQQ